MGELVDAAEAALRRARREEAKMERSRLDKCVPVWRYGVRVADRPYDTLFDSSCVWYSVFGVVTNREEAEAAGHSLKPGAMSYLFNVGSGRIVHRAGGGTIYLGGFSIGREVEQAAMDELGEFISENREGGDITHIVEKYRQ